MYAVIETGGKQYHVQAGDIIDIERLPGSDEKAASIKFDRILMVGDDKQVKIGDPVVKGAQVTGSLVDEVRAPKIRVFKMKRRKGYRRTQGHRQNLLRVKIDNIKAGAAKAAKTKKAEPKEAKQESKENGA